MWSFHTWAGHKRRMKAAYKSKTTKNPNDFSRKTRSKMIDSTKAINSLAWSLIHDNVQKTDILEDSIEDSIVVVFWRTGKIAAGFFAKSSNISKTFRKKFAKKLVFQKFTGNALIQLVYKFWRPQWNNIAWLRYTTTGYFILHNHDNHVSAIWNSVFLYSQIEQVAFAVKFFLIWNSVVWQLWVNRS